MFEHRGLSNSHAGIIRFVLFREVSQNVTTFLSQGRERRYTGTFLALFISFKNSLMLVRVLIVCEKEKKKGRCNESSGKLIKI